MTTTTTHPRRPLPELHRQALAVLPEGEFGYPTVKRQVDDATCYGVTTNGAYQILRELTEFGYLRQRIDGALTFWTAAH